MSVCSKIKEELKRRRFDVTYESEDEKRCLINFRDRKLFEKAKRKFGEDEALFIATSTVEYDKKTKSVKTNLVSPLEKFCELYLDYCCEKGEKGEEPINVCRVHLDPKYPRVGLEVKPITFEKFKAALNDFLNCIR